MRVKGFFVGTVSSEVKQITTVAKPFTTFLVESKGANDRYPSRLKVACYPERCTGVRQGALVAVSGDVSAEAYIGKTDGQAKGSLKLWAEQVDVHGSVEPVAAPIPGKADDDSSPPF